MTLDHILLFIFMLAGTLALVHAHRSGWPLDLWLEICRQSRRDHRSDDDRRYSDHPQSSEIHHDI